MRVAWFSIAATVLCAIVGIINVIAGDTKTAIIFALCSFTNLMLAISLIAGNRP